MSGDEDLLLNEAMEKIANRFRYLRDNGADTDLEALTALTIESLALIHVRLGMDVNFNWTAPVNSRTTRVTPGQPGTALNPHPPSPKRI